MVIDSNLFAGHINGVALAEHGFSLMQLVDDLLRPVAFSDKSPSSFTLL